VTIVVAGLVLTIMAGITIGICVRNRQMSYKYNLLVNEVNAQIELDDKDSEDVGKFSVDENH
jgi:hypothetical protein